MSTGMVCPHCGHDKSEVHDTRPRGKRTIVHQEPAPPQRRTCAECGERYSTVEVTERYLTSLEEARPASVIEQLMKARSALGTSIEILTNTSKMKDGLPL